MNIMFSLFVSGILFGSGPCLASCGPLLLSYIGATGKGIFQGLRDYTLFSLARIAAYLVLGLLVFFCGRFILERSLGDYAKYVFLIGGSFIILVGTSACLGYKWHLALCKVGGKSSFVLGLIIGFIPCAPLLALLTYVGLVSKTWIQALIYCACFGLGTFVSPLILLSIGSSIVPKMLSQKKAIYAKIFGLACGLIIIVFGIQLLRKGF